MAGAIVNPYAISAGTLSYEDECKADTPLGLWMLDETSGTVATNQGSASASNASYGSTYSPVLGTRTIFGLTTPDFQGTDVVTLTDNAALGASHAGVTGTGTWEFLFRQDTTVAVAHLWQKFANGAPTDFWIADGGLFIAGIRDSAGSSVTSIFAFSAITAADTDYHIVVTYDRANQTEELWINGVSTATDTTASGSTSTSTVGMGFGGKDATSSGQGLNGSAGGYALYSQVLSDARIAAHYDALTA